MFQVVSQRLTAFRLGSVLSCAILASVSLGVSTCHRDDPLAEGPLLETSPWIQVVPLSNRAGVLEIPLASTEVRFLRMGATSFEPTSAVLEQNNSGRWVPVAMPNPWSVQPARPFALFQKLSSVAWALNPSLVQQRKPLRLRVQKTDNAAAFFNQVIVVDPALPLPQSPAQPLLHEEGRFGDALPGSLRFQNFPAEQVRRQQQSLVDPIIGHLPSGFTSALGGPSARHQSEELRWDDLQSKAFPLDFQKVLLAGLHDPAPGFAYQNGQWFVTVSSHELGISLNQSRPSEYHKEDRWFAPALKIGSDLIVPAPLSARTEYVRNPQGKMLPQWRLDWRTPDYQVTQWLSSQVVAGIPQIVSRFSIRRQPAKHTKHERRPRTQTQREVPSLILGVGRRPSVHFWAQQNPERNLLNKLALHPMFRARGSHAIIDGENALVLISDASLRLLPAGPAESVVEFPLASLSTTDEALLYVSTPQRLAAGGGDGEPSVSVEAYQTAQAAFEELWGQELSRGASVHLPSQQWNARLDGWLSQVMSISRIESRLNYGAYYYDMYFGIEEGWPVVALAQWGRGDEAKAQADIMMSPGVLDRNNYHHQYRNGLGSWYAAEVARYTDDTAWLERISSTLVDNAQWTIEARRRDEGLRSPLSRGLLPRHIYGGDISTPAYSIYSNVTCWRGLTETVGALRRLPVEESREELIQRFQAEAAEYKARLTAVAHEVLVRDATPAFLPLALELGTQPPGGAVHETPYDRLTAHALGNYWNLFAPMLLHLDWLRSDDAQLPSGWLVDYLENHGGLWAGLPRFYSGLDAVYALGYIHELLERSKRDVRVRPKALAALQSYMMHAASSNAYAVPEVAGMFNARFDRTAYEREVRSAPWSFGIYDGGAYLRGDISITEPLGAGAGAGLWLLRKALVDETKNSDALPDGGLSLLPSIPSEWLAEGKSIQLHDMPTAYGLISLDVRSHIESRGEVEVSFSRQTSTATPLQKVSLRLVGPEGHGPQNPTTQDPFSVDLPVGGVARQVIPMQ